MEERLVCGIYKIRNRINDKVYIGQSVNVYKRFSQHKLGGDLYIDRAIRKYGADNFDFDIVEECDVEELNDKEKFYIGKYNSYVGKGSLDKDHGYNLTLGGDGGSCVEIDEPETMSLYLEGQSVNEISRRMDCSPSVVKRVLRKKGFKLRTWYEQKMKKREWNSFHMWPEFIKGKNIEELCDYFGITRRRVIVTLVERLPEEIGQTMFLELIEKAGITKEEEEKYLLSSFN